MAHRSRKQVGLFLQSSSDGGYINHMQDLILLRFVWSDRPKDSIAHYPGYVYQTPCA